MIPHPLAAEQGNFTQAHRQDFGARKFPFPFRYGHEMLTDESQYIDEIYGFHSLDESPIIKNHSTNNVVVY